MSNRIDLSADTHIEDMDGRRYLVSVRPSDAVEWLQIPWSEGEYQGPQGRWIEDGVPEEWDTLDGDTIMSFAEYRILLTDVAPVYAYVEGEMAVYLALRNAPMELVPASAAFVGDMIGIIMHRRAAAVCDGAEQFRLFHGELQEARG